jgi:hypothetical protein
MRPQERAGKEVKDEKRQSLKKRLAMRAKKQNVVFKESQVR